jgi:hypothetical protein
MMDKLSLRKFLAAQVRAYQGGHKEPDAELARRRQAAFEKALLALFDISEDFPEEMHWRQTALRLAFELFGQKKGGRAQGFRREERQKVFLLFVGYQTAHSGLSRAAAAVNFLNANRDRLRGAGFKKAKNFAEAFGRWRVNPVTARWLATHAHQHALGEQATDKDWEAAVDADHAVLEVDQAIRKAAALRYVREARNKNAAEAVDWQAARAKLVQQNEAEEHGEAKDISTGAVVRK